MINFVHDLQVHNNPGKKKTKLIIGELLALQSLMYRARFYDVNRRSAPAMWINGGGMAALTKFCAIMNIPGRVENKSFQHMSR